MVPALLLTPSAAFLAGLVTSLHCAGMCGPLACAILPGTPRGGSEVPTAYQLGRVASYACLGALAGGLGRLPLSWLPAEALRFAPFLAVVFFIGAAFRWDRRWAKPPGLGQSLFRWVRRMGRRSPVGAAALLGGATPLLPCGPLYLFLGIALLAGSALRGSELMLAFALGTLPLLWFVQSQFGRLQGRLSPRWLGRVRLTLSLVAAGLAAWRAAMNFASPSAPWICF